jgi:two-component system chemotaxis response regulator CheY
MARIVIVDDSRVMRMNIRTVIMRMGHEVVAEAADGSEAITACLLHNPDLVIMDITMPVMDGITSSKKILQNTPNMKIIMVSSLDHEEWVLEAIKGGAKNYLIKPVRAEILQQAISELLRC